FGGGDTPYLLGQRSLPYSTSSGWVAWKFLDSMPTITRCIPTMTFSRCMLAGSLDHLIGLEAQERGDRDPERLGGLEVDDELVAHRLLHREVSRWGAFQDLIHQDGNALPEVRHPRPIAHQSTQLHKGSRPVDRWQPTLGRECCEAFLILIRGEEEGRQD